MYDELDGGVNNELHGLLVTIGYICSFSYIVGSVVLDILW